MECQRIINLLYNKLNQPSKFHTKNWVEIKYNSCGKYNEDNQIRFKTSVLKSSFCYYKIKFP